MTVHQTPVEERVARQVERIRSAVEARHGARSPDAPDGAPRVRVDEVARLASVNAHWGIASHVPVFGSAVVLWRRMLRLLLRWYINPIVEQQNAFNQAVVRTLFDLQMENAELRDALVRSEPGSAAG